MQNTGMTVVNKLDLVVALMSLCAIQDEIQ